MTQTPSSGNDPFVKRTDDTAAPHGAAPYGTAPHGGVPYYEAPTGYDAPAGSQDATTAFPAPAQDTDRSAATVAPPVVGEPEDAATVVAAKRGTSDLGLLLLRVGLGLLLAAHGAQKVFALFDGPGIDGFTGLLTSSGYDEPSLLAYVGSITELVAGLLLVLGFATPLAGAAALGTMINAWFVSDLAEPGFRFFGSAQGQELEMLLVLLSAVVILVGPGRYSLDRGRGWSTRPLVSSWLALVIGVGSGLAVWFVLNGATPFA